MDVAATRKPRGRWLELPEGQWRGDGNEPRGRLRMRVQSISRSTVPGFVRITGWRHLGDGAEPYVVHVLVREEVIRATPGGER